MKTALVALLAVVLQTGTPAREVRVMSAGATAPAYLQIIPRFEATTKLKAVTLALSTGLGAEAIVTRVHGGEPVDVILIASNVMDDLVKDGSVQASSRVEIARSSIAMAVRSGAPKPDISTVEALKQTILNARSIAVSSQISGVYLTTELFQKLGVAEQALPKTTKVLKGFAGELVASGQADIAFQQVSELSAVKGIDLVGPLPAAVQRVSTFSVGIAAKAPNPAGARAFVDLLLSAEGRRIMQQSGLEPIPQTRGPVQLANAPVPDGARRINYGRDAMQFGELRVPATNGPHPVAIVVHGGCWMAQFGSYDPHSLSFAIMRPMANALTEAGIATWNIEYRRLDQPGGGWPGTFLDVAAAADFLRTIATPEQLDLNRVIAIGHSAGGHLAMWLAARAKIKSDSDVYTKDPIRLAGAVNLDGPADLAAAAAIEEQICGNPVITRLMGGAPDERPDRYRAASPAALLPYGGRHAFLAGAMFGSQVEAYSAAARQAGDTIAVATNFVKAGHFLFIDPQSTIWPEVLQAVRKSLP